MTSSSDQIIAVAGATGFVGRHVVRALIERGHAVRALVRDPEKADSAFGGLDVERVYADSLDERAAQRLLAGARGVVNCIGIRRERSPDLTFRSAHVQVVRRLIASAQEARARRFVHISALGVRALAPTAYQRSKFEGETLLRESRLDWTILRPSLIHGPDGELIGMIRDWVLGRAAPRGFLPYFARVERREGKPLAPPMLTSALIQPIHVDDVALAVVSAFDSDRSIGEVYPLAGPEEISWPELLCLVRDAMPLTDSRKRPRPIPAPLGLAVAHAAGVLGLGEAVPFGPSEPVLATEDSIASIEKARGHLAFMPRGFEASLHGYAAEI